MVFEIFLNSKIVTRKTPKPELRTASIRSLSLLYKNNGRVSVRSVRVRMLQLQPRSGTTDAQNQNAMSEQEVEKVAKFTEHRLLLMHQL